MIIKVSLKNNPFSEIPGVGGQLRNHTLSGKNLYGIKLKWKSVLSSYPAGTKYKLRKPQLKFKIPAI